jgi:putative Mg2+ transporter-C (MgtC) family protein
LTGLSALVAGWLALPLVRLDLDLLTAFVLGAAIGFERQWRQRNAGLRTNVLVCVGAAAFTAVGIRLLGNDGGTRIIAYVVSGIGFLGAGVILKDGGSVRGLNTAATLWCSAAVGATAGSGMAGEAASLTVFVLAGNTLLRPLVNWVNRRPMRDTGTEARYRVIVTCLRTDAADVRDLLTDVLEAADYPVQDVETTFEGEHEMELTAVLTSLDADAAELDSLVTRLEEAPEVESATWSASITG